MTARHGARSMACTAILIPTIRRFSGKDRTVANTTPVWHGGRLLMTKEDGLPYEVDPKSLETKGQFNYGGRLKSQTFTAHPRFDDEIGEMFFFGYEASGLATRDVAFGIEDQERGPGARGMV